MPSTRYAAPGAEPADERFASSPVLKCHGAPANLVALRSQVLKSPDDLELLWSIQERSHVDNGYEGVVADLLLHCPEYFRPHGLIGFSGDYSAPLPTELVHALRAGLKCEGKFHLRGEFTENEKLIMGLGGDDFCESDQATQRIQAESDRRPQWLPAQAFIDWCKTEAGWKLAAHLENLCLDPEMTFDGPCYCPELKAALVKLMERQKTLSDIPLTAITKELREAVFYARRTGQIVLFCGPHGLGKSTQARALAEGMPGICRYVHVPNGNDRRTWFVRFLEAYGQATGGLKAQVLQGKVEKILRASRAVPIIDDALAALPNHERDANPDRLDWLTNMVSEGVGCVLITSPDFYDRFIAITARSKWTGADFLERVYAWAVPERLTREELRAIARHMMPGLSDESIESAVISTENSGNRSCHWLEKIRCLAANHAESEGRKGEISDDDVGHCMKRKLAPSVSRHMEALEEARKRTGKRVKPKKTPFTGGAPAPRTDTAENEPRGSSAPVSRALGVDTASGPRGMIPEGLKSLA